MAPAEPQHLSRSPRISGQEQGFAALLPVPLASQAGHQAPVGGLLPQAQLPLLDQIGPLQPDIEHAALDRLSIPVAALGGVDGPGEQIIELKRAEATKDQPRLVVTTGGKVLL